MKFRSVIISLTVLGILAGFQSCKPVRSEKSQSQSKDQEALPEGLNGALNQKVTSDLKIGFYLAEEGSSVPDFDHPASSKLLEGVIRDEAGIQLKNRVPIGSNKLFLAIADSFRNKPIVDASYEYHRVSAGNSTQGDAHRALLSYDRDKHQYFLAIDELSKSNSETLSSLDLQVLTFNLVFNDGSRSQFDVRFYLRPALPQVEQIRVSQVFSEPSVPQASLVKKDGWVFLTERYANPTSHPLFLWFSSAGISYQLETKLGVQLDWKLDENLTLIPNARPQTENGFEPDLHRFSKVPLERMSLLIRDLQTNQFRTLVLSKIAGHPVEILPGQSLKVEWRLAAAESVPLCHAGDPISRTFWPCNAPGPAAWSRVPGCAAPESPWVPEKFKNPFQIHGVWAVQESRLAGEFKGAVKVTEEIGTKPSVLSRAESEALALSIPVSSMTPSQIQTGAEMDSCQGIYD